MKFNKIFENKSKVKDCAVFGVVFLQCDQSGRDLKVLRPMNQQRGERNIYPYKQKEDVKIFNRLTSNNHLVVSKNYSSENYL